MVEIRSVIFDIDNTLYDYAFAEQEARKALYHYCEKTGLFSPAEFPELHDRMFQDQLRQLGETAAAHNRLIRFQHMLEAKGFPIFPHALNLSDLYWNEFYRHMIPEDGIPELIQLLHDKKISIGIGTNMTSEQQFRKLMHLGLDSQIDFITTSEEVGADKPDSAIFQSCVQKSGFSPSQCLFIGDNLTCDVYGALNAGLHAAFYLPERHRCTGTVPAGVPVITSYRSCISNHTVRFGESLIL